VCYEVSITIGGGGVKRGSREELSAWIIPVEAARLREEVPGEEQMLVEFVERGLREN
jgi:hypothetical protein